MVANSVQRCHSFTSRAIVVATELHVDNIKKGETFDSLFDITLDLLREKYFG